jgi:sulfonate transport system substrate-binding protein
MSHTTARRLGTLTLAGALALMTAACSSGGSSATDVSAQGGNSSTITINFGDQQQDFETLLTDSGVLKGADYKVNFVEFGSGPLVDAGFAAHRLDVGEMGDLPASLAVKSGLPVTAIAVSLPVGASEFLLAKPGITAISQLRGKPVAYTTGTAEQAFALRALHSAGLTQKDVQQVNVTLQELGTALDSGAAYASVVSVEQKVDYEQTHPNAVILATQTTVSPASYSATTRPWPARPSSRRSTTCSSASSRPRTGRSPTRRSGSPITTSTSSTRRRRSPRSSSPRAAPPTTWRSAAASRARCSRSSR